MTTKTGEEDDLDSDDSLLDTKERHSSGESNDSAVYLSTPTSPSKSEPSKRFLVIPSEFCQASDVRGILKRPRCFSETSLMTMTSEDKKSVRFNEVVQRQVYR